MIEVSGYLHRAYNGAQEEEKGVGVPISSLGSIGTQSTSLDFTPLRRLEYSEISMNGSRVSRPNRDNAASPSKREMLSLARQISLQYGGDLARHRPVSQKSLAAHSQNVKQIIHSLREVNHLYLSYSRQYDLSQWYTYNAQPLTYGFSLQELMPASVNFQDLQFLISQIEARSHMLERLYLRLPYLSAQKRRPGYAQAFSMLTDGVLLALRRVLRSSSNEDQT
ncbi:hypothetical protein [Pseudovibrio sp. Tun.PSC04-5.I4]|uniref:hypothetical protein n=1 Tax=Pseudovibrio sp. Tun.PSC04-5.I4 TaxID=1798213 RepID=UPI00087F22BC|nr:hypothetical protein [Pseudovibrio sp. Tun.PSC04-5.I4]SDR14977.1 hypothetical protein SAMN04515695_3027 [Pseudovibrio sp. Tun.PSC04-5.I4]